MAEVEVTCDGSAFGDRWSLFWGDSGCLLPQFPDASIGLSVYSIPFFSLFTYSESAADLGNCQNEDEFFAQYTYIVREKLRVTKPGRLSVVYCCDLPTRKWKDGYIGSKRFSDQISELHDKIGWHFVRRVTIWRDPVVEMTRTKSLNLLHKQVIKDSTCSWPGTPDYLLIFRKPGDNAEAVSHTHADFPVDLWQKWASPVWYDIQQTDTLNNRASASRWIGDPVSLDAVRDEDDEKHLCPLQLHLIERAVLMWSNPGDVVLSPFAGIGSEGVVALRRRRKFLGCELSERYFASAARNLAAAEANTGTLFDAMAIAAA